ncbi:diuretic hormone receptor-like isoform X2 [Condylostylus longicornis]|uniref:diuretic hormone receptor-like isoform X2 n=1 Tax=Condylostylus longicornis TaxID=2530218 RepID=UPI00244DEF14|nr:diuretic hormone receptor-like isoform X2 [Condylostylus longicornis]
MKSSSSEVGELSDLEFFIHSNTSTANQTALTQCLIRQFEELSLYENDTYCPTNFDSVLCWPRTPRGTIASLPCMEELVGLRYDTSQNATRYCHINGTWNSRTDYEACDYISLNTPPESEFGIAELTSITYSIGYSLSLISLSLALIVFTYFKELRCLRNTIHANLFFTHIMSALMWILTLSVHISVQIGVAGCIVLVFLLNFFTVTNFFWMMVEGLYLYILVVKTFSGDNIRFNIYALIGWAAPAIIVISWAIPRSIVSSSEESNDLAHLKLAIECPWMKESEIDWIFKGPIIAALILNLLFLLRIMWVLITKLRSANTIETRQYRKAAKALLVLIPLFGITYLVVLWGPDQGVIGSIFQIVRALLISTQGFSVSLLYCFLNSEVRSALRHQLNRWQEQRDIRIGQMRQSRRPLTSKYDKRESCASVTTTTLIGTSTIHQRGSNGALQNISISRAVSPSNPKQETQRIQFKV